MKALAYDPASDRFVLTEQPQPIPGEHDVLVRVHACGLNPADATIHLWQNSALGMIAAWVGGSTSGRPHTRAQSERAQLQPAEPGRRSPA